jgi:signal transduction histidine kinase
MPDVIDLELLWPPTAGRGWIDVTMRLTAVASFGVYAFTCLLQAGLVGEIALHGDGGAVAASAVFSAAVLAVHCWHLRFALQGRQPPHGVVTVVVVVVVIAAGQAVIGAAWTWTFALGAVSAVLVLPRIAGWAALLVVVATVYLLQPFDQGVFYALSTAYRSVILVSVVWFVATLRQLNEVRAALARDAIIDERERVGARLAAALGGQLAGLTCTARDARALLSQRRDDEVASALQSMGVDARGALDATRRIVTDLRRAEAYDELRSARALLAHDDASIAGST